MRKRRKSLILYGAERVAGFLHAMLGKSILVQKISGAGMRAESLFRQGYFRVFSDREVGREAWQYRFRQACLRANENSLLLGGCRKLSSELLQTALGSFGSFGVLYGAFSASLWFAATPTARGFADLIASLILTVVSVPLLHAGRSLSSAIRHSVILGSFLFGFCSISRDSFGSEEHGRERHWLALFLALLCGAVSFFIPSTYFLFAIGLILLWFLFIACPELPAVLLLFFLPFLNFLSHPTMLLCGGVLLCDIAWLWKAVCGRRRLRFGLIEFTVLSFAVLLLFGGIFGSGGYQGLQSALAMLLLLSFWFPAVSLFSQRIWRKRAFFALELAGFLLAVYGIGQYFFTDLELLWVDTSRFSDIGGRVCGSFSNPNLFAVYLLSITPFMFAGSFDPSRKAARRVFDFIAFCLATLCLVFTWSRGAWLGLIAAVLLFFIAYSYRSFGLLMLSILPMLAMLPFLPHSVTNRFSSIGSLSESSIRYRLYTWRGALRLTQAHPWGIGVGEHAFHSIYPQYAVSGTETVMHAHQLFLQILTELGIPGLLLFLFLLIQLCLSLAKGLHVLREETRAGLLGCAGAVLAVLIMGLFDYVWYHLGLFFLFFVICAGLSAVVGEEDMYEKGICT